MNIKGLKLNEVEENRKKYGTNRIEATNNNSFFKLLIETLGDPIIKILLIALILYFIFSKKSITMYSKEKRVSL